MGGGGNRALRIMMRLPSMHVRIYLLEEGALIVGF